MSLLGGGLTGDIWSTGAFSFESPLKDLLDSEDYTLEQLLAEDELLQELRGVHPKLTAYFSTENAVTKLIEYVILAPDAPYPASGKTAASKNGVTAAAKEGEEVDNLSSFRKDPGLWLMQHLEMGKNNNAAAKPKTPQDDPVLRHIRFPYMACEVICCEIPGIINTIIDGNVASGEKEIIHNESENEETVEVVEPQKTRILDLLFSLLLNTPVGKLDDYRAGYFEKVLRVLFKKRQDDMAEYMNTGGGRGKEPLMRAMLKHLYSHSIMQVSQRLLLPQRPVPKKTPEEKAEEEENNIVAEAEVPEDSGEIKSDWSKSMEAIDLLLDSLIGEDVEGPLSAEERERKLDLSLNTSEVLITVIQNSMLSSETMLTLTSTPFLERIIRAATVLRRDDNNFFSPHESLLTSAMTVMESLILQLGGYGAVGTMSLVPEEGEEGDEQKTEDGESEEDKAHLIADLGDLLCLLPWFLDSLSLLLRHPSTMDWKTPTQYSKTEPQLMLGSSRLRIVRVLESLVLLGDPDVDAKLVESDCLEVSLNLFWEFQWCSMLHQSVANLLVHVFEGRNARVDMQEYFLIRCNILVRLMDSFVDIHSETRISDVVMDTRDVNVSGAPSESEKGSTDDPLPISEDDVDAALEKQEDEAAKQAKEAGREGTEGQESNSVEQVSTQSVQFESREGSTVGTGAPPQSFRFGYMGHVIIICQALVHACTRDIDEDEATQQEARSSGESITSSTMRSETSEKEPLFLAEMVACHPLTERWRDFVSTTLATETATQSTPLGGYSISTPSSDPLHGHRPGLADEADALGLDATGPPLPPRGMLAGGDVIDMDDNDIEMAASMMAGLAVERPSVPEPEDENAGSAGSGDSDKTYNSNETDTQGYLFDDPLGKVNGGLGIELGKLTQFTSGKGSADDEQDDDSDRSSSDEEPEKTEVPVMDLFAGNFNYGGQGQSPSSDAGGKDWSNFANFDDAFAGQPNATPPSADEDDDFGPFSSAAPEGEAMNASTSSLNVDDLFGASDHVDLLDVVAKIQAQAPPPAEFAPAVQVQARKPQPPPTHPEPETPEAEAMPPEAADSVAKDEVSPVSVEVIASVPSDEADGDKGGGTPEGGGSQGNVEAEVPVEASR